MNEVEHDRHLVDTHAGSRLVEQKDLRLERDQDGDFELALIAVRQEDRAHVTTSGQADLTKDIVGFLDQLGVLPPGVDQIEAGAAAALHRKPHVLVNAEIRKQIGELKCAAEPAPRALRTAPSP